jgi:hypothetical protein
MWVSELLYLTSQSLLFCQFTFTAFKRIDPAFGVKISHGTHVLTEGTGSTQQIFARYIYTYTYIYIHTRRVYTQHMLSHQCSYTQAIILSRFDPVALSFSLHPIAPILTPPTMSTVWSPPIPGDDKPPTASASEVTVPPPSIVTEVPHAPSASELTAPPRSSALMRSPRRRLQFQLRRTHVSPCGSTSPCVDPCPHHHLMTTAVGYDSTRAGNEDLELP